MSYNDFFDEYEARHNKNVPVKKDFDRILDIYKFSKDRLADERKMAHLIKDKSKALRRGLTTLLLRGITEPEQLEKRWITAYTGSFFDKAKSLGATEAEAQKALSDAVKLGDYKKYVAEYENFDNNINHETVEKNGEEIKKISSGRWLNTLNKKLSQEHIPYKYENSEAGVSDRKGFATTNSRKWAERTTLVTWPGEDRELKITIEILTDEGGGTTRFDVIKVEGKFASKLILARNSTGYINLNKLFGSINNYNKIFI